MIQIQKAKRSKKSKRPDTRPARKRYWARRQLEKHKVRNLVRYCNMTKQAALQLWNKIRIERVPKGFMEKGN